MIVKVKHHVSNGKYSYPRLTLPKDFIGKFVNVTMVENEDAAMLLQYEEELEKKRKEVKELEYKLEQKKNEIEIQIEKENEFRLLKHKEQLEKLREARKNDK